MRVVAEELEKNWFHKRAVVLLLVEDKFIRQCYS